MDWSILCWNGSWLYPMRLHLLKKTVVLITCAYWTSIYFTTYRVCLTKNLCSIFNSITFSKATFWENIFIISEVNLRSFWNFPRNIISQRLEFYDLPTPLPPETSSSTCRQLCRPILDDRDVLAVAPRGVKIWWKFLFMASQPTPDPTKSWKPGLHIY